MYKLVTGMDPLTVTLKRVEYNPKFANTTYSYQAKLDDDFVKTAPLTEILPSLSATFREVLQDCTRGHPPSALMRVAVGMYDGLYVSTSVKSVSNMGPEHILTKIEEAVQSNEEIYLKNTFKLDISVLGGGNGAGPTTSPEKPNESGLYGGCHTSMLQNPGDATNRVSESPNNAKTSSEGHTPLRNKGVLHIRDSDHLSLARAIVVGLSRLNGTERNNPELKNLLHKQRPYHLLSAARNLYQRLGFRSEFCTLSHVHLFAKHLGIQVRVYNSKAERIYDGWPYGSRCINLLQTNACHFHVIAHLKRFVADSQK